MLKTLVASLTLAGCMSGCATVPDVTYHYYPAGWSSNVTVVRTIACDKAKKHVFILSTSAINTTYFADTSKDPVSIRFADLSGGLGWLSDSDLSVGFTDDGRLKSVNQSSTGQGEAILKAGAALVTTFATIAAADQPSPECERIAQIDDGKPVSLIYRATARTAPVATIDFELDRPSRGLYDRLQMPSFLPTPTLAVTAIKAAPRRVSYEADKFDKVFLLPLQETGSVTLTATVGGESLEALKATVPTGTIYTLPIPKAALFGKQTFSISLADTGAISSIGYGKSSGTAGALSGLNSVGGLETTTAKAAVLKAEADLIAQQTRLTTCQAKPGECK